MEVHDRYTVWLAVLGIPKRAPVVELESAFANRFSGGRHRRQPIRRAALPLSRESRHEPAPCGYRIPCSESNRAGVRSAARFVPPSDAWITQQYRLAV